MGKAKRRRAPRKSNEAKEHRLENDQRFLRRIDSARRSLKAGRGVRLEDLKS
jgi:hypothetical protein